MSGFYKVSYAIGFRPWEQAGEQGAEQIGRLLDRETADRPTPPGRAVDLGCGTGAHTIGLARRGWRAIGVDNQPRALQIARARAAQAGADVAFQLGDVTTLRLDEAADFFLDVGCFHHLPRTAQRATADCVTAAAAPGATLLMLAFSPGRRGPLPRGASQDDIEAAFVRWKAIDDEPADTTGLPRALRGSAPHWFRLRLSEA